MPAVEALAEHHALDLRGDADRVELAGLGEREQPAADGDAGRVPPALGREREPAQAGRSVRLGARPPRYAGGPVAANVARGRSGSGSAGTATTS